MADVMTTNFPNTLRPAVEVSGYAEMAREINVRTPDDGR